VSNYKPAEIFTLEEMITRFLYVETNDDVQDLKTHHTVPLRQFIKSHKSSMTEVKGKMVETTKLWEHSPQRKQVRYLNYNTAMTVARAIEAGTAPEWLDVSK
jgi:hypothetical protein